MDTEDDTLDYILKPADEAFQEIGKAYCFSALGDIFEDHGMEFAPGMLEAFMEAVSDRPLFGPLTVDDVRSVLLEHCTETTEDGHLFAGDSIREAFESLLNRYRVEIVRVWESKEWAETGVDSDGDFIYNIRLIDAGESFEQYSPKLLKLISAVAR